MLDDRNRHGNHENRDGHHHDVVDRYGLSTDVLDDLSHHHGNHGHRKNEPDDHSTDGLDGRCDPSTDALDDPNHHDLGDQKNLMSAQDANYRQIEDLSLGAMIVNGHHLVLHVS